MILAGIPAYNEEKTIAKVILLTKKYVDKIIVVDDGSTDMTGEIARALGAEVIRHRVNRGKGEALKTIFKKVKEEKPDVLVLLDADDQHNPHDIPKLVEPILRGEADIVIGSRFLAGSKVPLGRRIGLVALSKLIGKSLDGKITDPLSGFRALSRRTYESIELNEEGYGVEVEMLLLAREKGLRVVEVPTKIRYDQDVKTSKRGALFQATEIIGSIIRRTVWKHPLVYLGVPGVVLLCLGLFLTVLLVFVPSFLIKSALFSSTITFTIPVFILTGIVLITNALLITLINDVKMLIAQEARKEASILSKKDIDNEQ